MTTPDASPPLIIPPERAATLVDPAAYARDTIHESYRWLRANNPLGIAEVPDFDPFWVVTKHADILHVSRNNSLFHSADRPTTLTNRHGEELARQTTGTPNLVRSLVQMDEPDHMKYRALTQAWFLRPNLKAREAAVRAIARKTVARFLDTGGQCDFATDISLHYPLEVVMQILGVPDEDYPLMLKLTQELFGPQDPDTARVMDALTPEQFAAMMQATIGEFTDYFDRLSAERRRTPRDDLATVIANAEIDGRPIAPLEATGYYMIVATAGHDTTSSSTSGAMWALATQPGLLDTVRDDPARIPDLIEEAVRWTTPVKTFMRSPTADTELRGRKLARGDWMMLCYASGNRDEEVFEAPYRFDIDRPALRRQQIAFGSGAHVCLGQHLARMEMTILFEELLPKLRSVELAGEARYIESTFVNGLKRLPIRFRAA